MIKPRGLKIRRVGRSLGTSRKRKEAGCSEVGESPCEPFPDLSLTRTGLTGTCMQSRVNPLSFFSTKGTLLSEEINCHLHVKNIGFISLSYEMPKTHVHGLARGERAFLHWDKDMRFWHCTA